MKVRFYCMKSEKKCKNCGNIAQLNTQCYKYICAKCGETEEFIKKPKNQICWVTQIGIKNVPTHIITSDEARTKYFLYKIDEDGNLEKIKTAKEPIF